MHHKTAKQYTKTKKIIIILRPGICTHDPLTTIRFPQRRLSEQSLGN